MTTTTLKASYAVANGIANKLANHRRPSGAPIFTREETTSGFQVCGFTRDAEGAKIKTAVLIYTSDPAPRIEYDERLITIN